MARDEPRNEREMLREVFDRCRRIETRVTMVANHVGVDAGSEKPVLDKECSSLHVPNRRVALEDIIEALQGRVSRPIDVICDGKYLLTVDFQA